MNRELLNRNLIVENLTQEAPWADSHGAEQEYLGLGLLYYTIVYMLKARVAVCLGSGGGFVPRLMRQAQRDLGIAEASRTILVDGDIADGGWGTPAWLAHDSFFRQQFPDVEIIIDLTSNAAKNVFAQHDIRIDYLHIDADHSFAGCFEDFTTYRRFLHEGSIITLHDTNLLGAGVRQVVEYLRTLSDCEVIDFPNVGEGTALVRIGSNPEGSRFRTPYVGQEGDADSVIAVTKHEDAQPLTPGEKEWKYLESRAFSTRYALAAYFVDPCRSVIEIGGGKTSIDQFLAEPHDRVLVLDPFLWERHADSLRGQPCQISYVRARFQDVDWRIPPGTEYGLVMLGLEIQGLEPHHYTTLYQLINHAKVTVIEFPPSWAPSREQFEMIRNNTQTTVTFRTTLDLEGNDFGNLENSWPPRCEREIYVLEPDTSSVGHVDPQKKESEDMPLVPSERGADTSLISLWSRALAGDRQVQARWQITEGGIWSWENEGVRLKPSGAEWAGYEWRGIGSQDFSAFTNFVIEVTVSGKAEAAGLSFGPYKDFLVSLDSPRGERRLQLEIDVDAGCWAFRVDGQLMKRCWWDSAVHGVNDLINGVLTLKAKYGEEVLFQHLAIHPLQAPCRLSVIMTCYRFLQRLRVSLRTWCHQSISPGAYEVLVVNPQSPDGTHEHLAAVARSYPHVRVREIAVDAQLATNKGAMINRAVQMSRGEWIWLTDADCLFAPDCVATVLNHVDGQNSHLFYGQRRYLTAAQTDALLSGRVDALRDFDELVRTANVRPPENTPWGYTQIVHRATLARVHYHESVNHFAHTDEMFAADCQRQRILPRQINGLFCLHLDHPFAWYGTNAFL